MNLKLIRITEDIKEEDFPKIIKKYNFRALKFKKTNLKKIENKIRKMDNNVLFSLSYRELGKPDFFIWNDDEYYFCEFKSKTDSLSIQQIEWFSIHKYLRKALAFVSLEKEKTDFQIEISKDLIFTSEKDIRTIIRWKRFNILVNNYCEKRNPLTMLKYGNCWLGEIPEDLLKRLKEEKVI